MLLKWRQAGLIQTPVFIEDSHSIAGEFTEVGSAPGSTARPKRCATSPSSAQRTRPRLLDELAKRPKAAEESPRA